MSKLSRQMLRQRPRVAGLAVTLALAVGLVSVPLTSSATTANPRWIEDFYSLRASWLTTQANEPEVGQTTRVETIVMVTHGRTFIAGARGGGRSGTSRFGTGVCLFIETVVSDSATDETLEVVSEEGCNGESASFEVADDLSAATLRPTPVQLVAYDRICPPGDPGEVDCVFEPRPTGTTTVSSEWTAIAPSSEPFSFCFRGMTGTYQADRPAVATGTLNGEPLGESIPNDIFTWLYHFTSEAGCGPGARAPDQ